MLIELHLIQNHAPSNLNRDDTGSPKEAFFGGHRRARISSQCLKRSIRKSPLFAEELGDERAFRTKRLAGEVERSLREDLGLEPEEASQLARRAAALGSGKKQDKEAAEAAEAAQGESSPASKAPKSGGKKARPSKSEDPGPALTKQLIFAGVDEVRAIAEALLAIREEKREELATLGSDEIENEIARRLNPKGGPGRAIPAEIALFGRMTTSPAFEDVTASMQVAHALSTHKLDHEFDYYTAVDDLKDAEGGDDKGAGMVGDVEFNSSCFYKYFSLDWDDLVRKVHDADLALRAVRGFIRAAALTTPTGKQNGFAAHNPPDLVLVECKPRKVPVSYANAFVKPSAPAGGRDLVDDSIARLASYIEAIDRAYAIRSDRYWLATREALCPGTRVEGLEDLIGRVVAECRPDRGGASRP